MYSKSHKQKFWNTCSHKPGRWQEEDPDLRHGYRMWKKNYNYESKELEKDGEWKRGMKADGWGSQDPHRSYSVRRTRSIIMELTTLNSTNLWCIQYFQHCDMKTRCCTCCQYQSSWDCLQAVHPVLIKPQVYHMKETKLFLWWFYMSSAKNEVFQVLSKLMYTKNTKC